MRASIDTNVIMHFYGCDQQGLLYTLFETVHAHEFIVNTELKRHANQAITGQVFRDIESHLLLIESDQTMEDRGILPLFNERLREVRTLFYGSDLGEVYAITVAETLGLFALLTDDLKATGPYDFLLKRPEKDLFPFAFYDILVLDYLRSNYGSDVLHAKFQKVNGQLDNTQTFRSCMRRVIRRFWPSKPYNEYLEKDVAWMSDFCACHSIDLRAKLTDLQGYLR